MPDEDEEFTQGMNLDSSDTEFHQSPEHLPPSDFIRCASDGNLDEKAVVVGLVPETSANIELNGNRELTVIWAPAKPELASNRTPFPPALRYTSIFPISGWKFVAGSSVVIRHWIANPLFETAS